MRSRSVRFTVPHSTIFPVLLLEQGPTTSLHSFIDGRFRPVDLPKLFAERRVLERKGKKTGVSASDYGIAYTDLCKTKQKADKEQEARDVAVTSKKTDRPTEQKSGLVQDGTDRNRRKLPTDDKS
jgi:hypothetical protein